MSEKEYDLVLWGATGFTGSLAAEYLIEAAPPSLRWAIGGRSRGKLEAVHQRMREINAERAENVAILLGDAFDQESVDSIVASTRVILSTAGPFIRYGTPVVDACVRFGTHYCDITGESPWVRQLIDKYHDEAVAKNVHIVPFCGFDSIPFDLGAHMMAKAAESEGGLKFLEGYAKGNGSASGGTIHTIMNLLATIPLKEMGNPNILNPPNHRDDRVPEGGKDQVWCKYDPLIGHYTAPFVMSGVNKAVVKRSQKLYADAGMPYGKEGEFYYGEHELHKSYLSALLTTLGLGVFAFLLVFSWGRALLKLVVPAPGEGPSKEKRDKSWFFVNFVGDTLSGRRLTGKVSGGDPGYSETAKMVSEAALCLALQEEELQLPGGVLTAASSMGMTLVERLRVANMKFEVNA